MKKNIKRSIGYSLFIFIPQSLYAANQANLVGGLNNLVTYLTSTIAGFIAVIGLIMSGFNYYSGRTQEGNRYLKNTIIGTFIILAGVEIITKIYEWSGLTWKQ